MTDLNVYRMLVRDSMSQLFDTDIADTDVLLGEVTHKVAAEGVPQNADAIHATVARILGVS